MLYTRQKVLRTNFGHFNVSIDTDTQRYIPLFQGNLVRQQVFVIQNFLFRVPFTVAAKTFRAALDFINAHLQQRDQVASVLRTVDFW